MRRHAPGVRRAFTLIELLVVIAIIMAIMGMALPNFVAMTKERKWTAAFTDIQGLVWRARALATNARKDMSVEFSCQGDNGTWMWLESESNLVERLPNLDWLQHNLGGGGAIAWILFGEWNAAGGSFKWCKYELKCSKCGYSWVLYSPASPAGDCPNCGATDYPYVDYASYYYDIRPNPNAPSVSSSGDNARQGEIIKMGGSLTVDDSSSASPDFINWDAPGSVRVYGWDNYKDLRIATNGALVQTREPTICVRQIDGTERRKWLVVRCTGRLVSTR